ncbi:adenosylcobinamide-GDP ribazoletransferase [Phytohalomonas tamaricis]|uniref:adenosylcobinamide-GDP ribazoletransferase n=1 Tax=Phytohalomonas tamaricis TaxID=2081032 RepID=UPI000D0BA49D|nr:adenosylcobinamide-GDP ribazoletransferase [Phytohalomonas tamaricis]
MSPHAMQRQWQLLWLAIGFLTRWPIPAVTPSDNESLRACSRYFGLVGLGIGSVAACIYLVAALIWPPMVAVVLAMLIPVIMSGALHEDGLADTIDGFGGGWKVEDKLRIMKDSRLGSYGALGLMFALLLKFTLLDALIIDPGWVVTALLAGHCLSRVVAATLMHGLAYVRKTDSKIEALTGQQSRHDFLILLASAVIVALLVLGLEAGMLALVMMVLTWLALRLWLQRQLGGFTGDTLGAAQQLSELVIYALLVAYHA